MSDDVTGHGALRADLPEYVLGVLDGRARADVLTHLKNCDECADEVARLSVAADSILLIAPGAEPPVGFESRVMSQLRALDIAREPRAWRRGLLYAAAAVVVVALGIGWVVGHAATAPTTSAVGHMAEGNLLASGDDVGHVYAYTGTPSWMFVSVTVPRSNTSVTCDVVASDGRTVDLGTFALSDGHGSWGTPLPVAFAQVRSVVLRNAQGVSVARLNTTNWSTTSTHWAD